MERRGATKKDNVGKGIHAEKCLEELTTIVVMNPVTNGSLARRKRTVNHI